MNTTCKQITLIAINVVFFFWNPFAIAEVLPTNLNIQGYIKKNLSVNENIRITELQKNISQEKLNIANDVFQNTLQLRPSFYARDFKSESGLEFHEERPNISGSMTQKLPTGSLLGVESTYFLKDTNPSVGGTNSDLRLYFEQSLWRNAFGHQWRREQDSAKAEVQQLSLDVMSSIIESCVKSSEDYINAYLGQEELRLLAEAYSLAEKAQKIAQNGYAQSFLKKIDYLNSQSDFLKVKNEKLKTQSNFEQKLNTLKVQSESDVVSASLINPEDFFNQLPLNTEINKQDILRLQSLAAAIEAKKANYYAAKSENRTAADLGIETRQTKSVQPSNSGLLNAQQDIVQVYLKLELPLINKTRRAQVASAFHNWQLSEMEKEKQEKLIFDQIAQFNIQYKNIAEQIKILKETIRIKKQQLDEAIKLLRIGKIEFTDYIIYRDSLLNEEINLLRTTASHWQIKAKLAQYDNTLLRKCQETVL